MAVKVPPLLHKMSISAQKAWYSKHAPDQTPNHLKPQASAAKAKKEMDAAAKKKAAERMQAGLKAYGATKGLAVGGADGEEKELKDTIAPLSREQHSKVQAAKRAATPKKPLTKSQRMSAIAAAVRKRQEKYDYATLDPDNSAADDLVDVHNQLHIKKSYSEETEMSGLEEGRVKEKLVTEPEEEKRLEAEKTLGGPVKKMPSGPAGKYPLGYRMARSAAKKAMKAGMKEEVELDEASVNDREYASRDLMHPNMAKIMKPGDNVDFYSHDTSKISGMVTKNDGKFVHIKADPHHGGKLHMFKVQPHLPKTIKVEEAKGEPPAEFMPSDTKLPRIKVPAKPKPGVRKRGPVGSFNKKGFWNPGVREEIEQIDEVKQGKEYTKQQLVDKMKAGDWETSYDIKPGKHVEMTHRSGKKVSVYVKEEVEQVEEAKENVMLKAMDLRHGVDADKRVAGYKMSPTVRAAQKKSDELSKVVKRPQAGTLAAAKLKENLEKMVAAKFAKEETVVESEGKTPETPQETELAKHHGDPKKITYGDVIKARIKSARKKGMK